MSQPLSVESFTELWETTFLPSIRNEFKSEINDLRLEMREIKATFGEIEKSQKFLSKEFDNFKQKLQSTNKDLNEVSIKVKNLENQTSQLEDHYYNTEVALDELQQYNRRDCIEMSGIPVLPDENPTKLALELGKLIGHNIEESHISTAHRLPNTSKTKDRMIVQFVRRATKDKIYRSKNYLAGKTSKDLPSVAQEFGKSINSANKIYINESLTPYRKNYLGE
jgi:DNA repair exonuclease SbcCD ATPase subunit